jgi:hypothetical protein
MGKRHTGRRNEIIIFQNFSTWRLSINLKFIFPKFFERLKLYSEKSDTHYKEILDKYLSEEATIREQQMAVQHRLDDQTKNQTLDDFCLPAVFMPYKSPNNVYNPRAHQYFHPNGYTDVRLTQPPTVIQLPPLPTKTAVIFLDELFYSLLFKEHDPIFKH